MKKLFVSLLGMFLVSVGSTVFAQTSSPQLMSDISDIVVEYPGITDREAMVVLEFTVDASGQPTDFEVVDGFYDQRFVDATIDAVGSAVFSPAMSNGEAVAWPGYRLTSRFIIEDLFNTVQPGFSSAIRNIENDMAAGKYEQAERQALALKAEGVRYFYEHAYVNLRLSEIYLLQGRLQEAAVANSQAVLSYRNGEQKNYGLDSAKLVDSFNIQTVGQFVSNEFFNGMDTNASVMMDIDTHEPASTRRPPHLRSGLRYSSQGSDLGDKATMDILNAGLMTDALQAAVQIHARLGQIRSAKKAYERYADLNPRIPEILDQINALVDQSLEAGSPLQSRHQVYAGDSLFFPWRRIFTVANVADGQLTSVDFQCERRKIRLAFQVGAEWQIPDSWGNCALRFRGEEGTRFDIIEFE